MPMMKAMRNHTFGEPEVLLYEDVPRPEAGNGELLVRVHAAGVNPVDWKVRKRGGLGATLPAIVGWDVSGVVESVGAGVTDFHPGDAVYSMVRFPEPGSAYAEYVAAPAAHFALKPQTLDHVQAAALPLAALTAWQALFDTAQLAPGQTLLIHAAAGGVGHLALQLAKTKGARVIGTASARNADFLRDLGVDQFVDYTAGPFEHVVQDVDVVLDAAGDNTQHPSLTVLKPGDMLVSIVGLNDGIEEAAHNRGVHVQRILVHTSGAQLSQIAALVDAGKLKPFIEHILPLQEAAKAHQLSEAGRTRGKIVLRVV